jgi:hypothetical protein
MYRIIDYERPNKRKPAYDWIKEQDKNVRISIAGKREDLAKEGITLLNTNALLPIQGEDKGFYELRNVGLNWLIGVYHDLKHNAFVFLYGWHHDKNHPKKHEREIEKARSYLHEYREMEQRIHD